MRTNSFGEKAATAWPSPAMKNDPKKIVFLPYLGIFSEYIKLKFITISKMIMSKNC